MRGTRAMYMFVVSLTGIIPAYAGNTTVLHSGIKYYLGSSPRMRGTLLKGR